MIAGQENRTRAPRELANLLMLKDVDGTPLGVVVDLTRANAAERRSLGELADEQLFRRVPGVALASDATGLAYAGRLGFGTTMHVAGPSTREDIARAFELCRVLAGDHVLRWGASLRRARN